MTTELEAMTKMRCPQTRSNAKPDGRLCMGSKCMHWRWVHSEHRAESVEGVSHGVGFCGPAGRSA